MSIAEKAAEFGFFDPSNAEMYAAMRNGLLEQIDLGAVLQATARDSIELSAARLFGYSLRPVKSIARFQGEGFTDDFSENVEPGRQPKQFEDGYFYTVWLNAPLGIVLSYNGSPNSLVSFDLEEADDEIAIHQIQGIKRQLKPVPIVRGDIRGARGLAVLEFPKTMVTIAEEAARLYGISKASIKPAELVAGDGNRVHSNSGLYYPRARMLYDGTALSLDYRRVPGRWLKQIGPAPEIRLKDIIPS